MSTKSRPDDAELYAELFGGEPPEDLRPRKMGANGRPLARIPSRLVDRVVEVDVYAPRALVDEAQVVTPGCYELAMKEAPPPTVFASGDLPPFTASGLDPKVLNELPWQMRHYAAASESRSEVLQMVEDAAELGEAVLFEDRYQHAGRDSYEQRVKAWLIGPPENV